MKIKSIILFVTILISTNIFACKCENPDIKTSFERADFVFIGDIYDVLRTPSGFKNVDDYLSKVKIGKIYKSNNYDGFYKNNATIYASQLRSCDIIFDEKGKYLIFAYNEPDTGFLFSQQCMNTKKLNLASKEDLKTLDILSHSYFEKLKIENSKPIDVDNIEIVIDDNFNQPNRKMIRLNNENEQLKIENKNYKTWILVISTISLFITVILLFVKFKSKITIS